MSDDGSPRLATTHPRGLDRPAHPTQQPSLPLGHPGLGLGAPVILGDRGPPRRVRRLAPDRPAGPAGRQLVGLRAGGLLLLGQPPVGPVREFRLDQARGLRLLAGVPPAGLAVDGPAVGPVHGRLDRDHAGGRPLPDRPTVVRARPAGGVLRAVRRQHLPAARGRDGRRLPLARGLGLRHPDQGHPGHRPAVVRGQARMASAGDRPRSDRCRRRRVVRAHARRLARMGPGPHPDRRTGGHLGRGPDPVPRPPAVRRRDRRLGCPHGSPLDRPRRRDGGAAGPVVRRPEHAPGGHRAAPAGRGPRSRDARRGEPGGRRTYSRATAITPSFVAMSSSCSGEVSDGSSSIGTPLSSPTASDNILSPLRTCTLTAE